MEIQAPFTKVCNFLPLETSLRPSSVSQPMQIMAPSMKTYLYSRTQILHRIIPYSFVKMKVYIPASSIYNHNKQLHGAIDEV